MSYIKKFIILNLARFNRLRRKPLREITTYLTKRYKIALLHAADRCRILLGAVKLTDEQFFKKINLEDSKLRAAKVAVNKKDFVQAKSEYLNYMRIRSNPSLLINTSEKDELLSAVNSNFPQSRERVILYANEIIQHNFYLLGHRVNFTKDIDWHFSQSEGKSWPLTFSPNIDYMSSNRFGDIKITWELNRFQHLPILGKAYWYSNEEKYAKEYAQEILCWIESNPYKLGINWMEGIEVTLRLISWINSYSFFIKSNNFEEVHFELLKSIYLQSKFIERHLSDKWRINNNHLIAEVVGLVIVGTLFPEFKEASSWQKKGLTILEKELDKQILPDGFTWEYSTGYHKFITDLVILAAVVLKKNGYDIPKAILQKLDKMIGFLSIITKSDGTIPLFGDDDDGRAFKLTDGAYDNVANTMTLGAYILDEKILPQAKVEEAIWLLGKKTLTEQKLALDQSCLLSDSGLFIMRNLDMFVLFIVGPQNAKYLNSSHKHLDELSIMLEAYGTTFLVDSGTFTYLGDLDWRRYFKGRKAHNTSVIDDADPIRIEGAFELTTSQTGRICGWTTNDVFDWAAAKYSGYTSATHTRHLFFIKSGYVLIIDFFEGTGEHVYDLYYHFNCGLGVSINTQDHSVLSESTNTALKIVSFPDNDLKNELLSEWFSHSYGVKSTTCVLRQRRSCSMPKFFVTLLFPYKKGLPEEEIAQRITIDYVKIIERPVANNSLSKILECQVSINGKLDHFECSCPTIEDDTQTSFGAYKRQVSDLKNQEKCPISNRVM